jgi:small subunit ribosomal protein S1
MFQIKAFSDNSQLQQLIESEEKKDLHIDELIEGAVIAIEGTSVYVDLPGYGTGIIFGREFMNSKDIIKNLNIGDSIKGKIVDLENEEGYIELSLKEARQAMMWKEADQLIKDKTPITLKVKAANKGGLILSWQGVDGFLPASQLSAEHYPRVEDADKDAILVELKKLIDQSLTVTVISTNPKEGKLIFSEKGTTQEDKTEIISKYSIGDEIDGEVTGAVDFGLFLKIEDGLEGLVHISEIDWSLVEDPKALYKVGDKLKAKVIEIKDGKVSLSIKALKPNPWKLAEEKYKKGTEVDGVIIKFNKHGAVAAIEEGISGLVHISDFESEEQLRESLELGKKYTFKITIFEANNQKMALSYTAMQ